MAFYLVTAVGGPITLKSPVRELFLHSHLELLAPVAGQRPVAQYEAEISALLADEIRGRQHRIALGTTQPRPSC